ncbi:MAG: hypothetical protein ACI94Y_002731 [Maribacter sp.]|jgi:hypothetical protein
MLKLNNIRTAKIVAHRVGNKNKTEKNFISKEELSIGDNLDETLKKYFLKPFKQIAETYHFTHSVDMSYHLLNGIVKRIFEGNEEFYTASLDILNHLYEQSNHPQIKSGDLFVVLFDDILIEDELVQAVGIFKSEKKDAFLTLTESSEKVLVNSEEGISLKKLDKGCLILNIWEDQGYRVFSVDNNDYDASYWKEQFLGVDYVKDGNYDTRSYIDMCKSFADEVIREKTGKKDQIEFLSDSIQYFTMNEEIVDQNFQDTVFEDEKMKTDFNEYKKQYEEEYKIEIPDEIPISKPVLRQQKRAIKNFIKLDTGIQVKLDFKDPESTRQFVEKGFDADKGMHFYKVYYNEELD